MTEMKCRCDHVLKIAEFVSDRGRPLIFVVLYTFDSPLSTLCKREVESIEHLMFHCNVTDTFGKCFALGFVNVRLHYNLLQQCIFCMAFLTLEMIFHSQSSDSGNLIVYL